jgi:hypothetical protein
MQEVRKHLSDGIVVVISHQAHDHVGSTIHLEVNDGVVREVTPK